MSRTLLAAFALTASLQAAGTRDDGLVESAALPGAFVPEAVTLKTEADFKNQHLCSPMALTIDEQGRVFIAESHRLGAGVEDDRAHPEWFLDDLAATKIQDRQALHEKWSAKVPLARLTGKSEVVRRLADTDGDGSLDESKVFADDFHGLLDGAASGILAHDGVLYLGCIPKLLMLRDTDDGGRADERRTIQDGFGVRVSLSGNGLGGFTLGPDGRIYGTIGDRGLNFTTKEGLVCHLPNQGAVFRFELDGSRFELFHTGLRHPGKVAFDAFGYPIAVDSQSDQGDSGRVVYLVQGGDSGWEMEHQAMSSFHREIGLEKLPPNRWMDENMWQPANPGQPAFMVPPVANLSAGSSGLTYHPGTGFLEDQAGEFLVCDYRGKPADSGIRAFALNSDGCGMKMTQSRKILSGVAASDLEFSWDGRLLVTDFGGGWESHDDGRLLSLNAGSRTWRAQEAAGVAKIVKEGFSQRGSAELANP